MDEWLRIFNLKLRHMREDIASVRLGISITYMPSLFDLLVGNTALKS
jgi:hypothetical protein